MAGKRKKHYDKSVYRSFALVMQFGINMLVPICMMSVVGIWLDQKLSTSYWMVILFFVGAIAGGQNVFRLAKLIYASPGQRNPVRDSEAIRSDAEMVKKDTDGGSQMESEQDNGNENYRSTETEK